MDRIQELLGRLSELTDAEIVELESLMMSEFDTLESDEPTPESVEAMLSLADGLDALREEVVLRNERAEELTAKAKEAASRVRPAATTSEEPVEGSEAAVTPEAPMEDEEDEPVVTESEVVEDVETEDVEDDDMKKHKGKDALSTDAPEYEAVLATETAESDETPDTLAAEDPSTTPTTSTQEENTVTASADASGVVVTPPAGSAPIPSTESTTGIGLAITAGADIPGVGTGAVLNDLDDVAAAMAKRLDTLRNVQGGSGQQHTVATLAFDYPEDRRLSGSDPANISKINAVTAPAALTAAAGICAPLENRFEMDVCGVTDRPIRDALARFNADRGGIRLFGQPTLSGGAGIWNPASPTAKTCADAACVAPEEIGVSAIYACLNFSNYTNRFFPEVVKANTDLAMINHARQAELFLLGKIRAESALMTPTATADMGVARQMVRTLLDAAAYLRRKHRMRDTGPIRAILPSWVGDAMAADLAQQMPGDGLETLMVANDKINAIFRQRNVNVTWSPDAWDASGAAVAATGAGSPDSPVIARSGFDAKVSFPIFPEGAFLFLDGGTLDLGVVRDKTSLAANEYSTFVETFEGVAKIGCESLWINDLAVNVNGTAAALIDTTTV